MSCAAFVSLILVVLSTLLTLSINDTAHGLKDRLEIEQRLSFPADASNFRYAKHTTFMMSSVWIQFDVPSEASLEGFLHDLSAKDDAAELEYQYNPFANDDHEALLWWWDASRYTENIQGGIYRLRRDASPQRDFLILVYHGETVRVYLKVVDDV